MQSKIKYARHCQGLSLFTTDSLHLSGNVSNSSCSTSVCLRSEENQAPNNSTAKKFESHSAVDIVKENCHVASQLLYTHIESVHELGDSDHLGLAYETKHRF